MSIEIIIGCIVSVVVVLVVLIIWILVRRNRCMKLKSLFKWNRSQGIMISYAHKDVAFAQEVVTALKAAGFTVWIDTQLIPGADWRAGIANAIEHSFAVIFIVSPLSVVSKYCTEEVYYATNRKRPIFPIVYRDAFAALRGGMKMILQRI